LNPTDSNFSAFNIAGKIQSPNFSMEETSELFSQFAQENKFAIEDAVVRDIWDKSSG
jgi:hypothetical protein